LLNWSWDLKLQDSYTSLSLLLTTLKWLSSGQHTAPTNHQDKKNLPDQNPDSVLFLAEVFGINSRVVNNDTSLCSLDIPPTGIICLDICASTSSVIDHKLMGSDRNYTAMHTHV
jgi:hypothetical protein